MTIRHLKVFLQVYECQSVTKAAEALHMTQPAVSRALQELENGYGVRLFERLNHRLSNTEAGERLYPQALHTVRNFDRLEKDLRDWGEAGPVRVGATVTLGSFLLPELAARFRQQSPETELRVTVSNGDHLLDAIRQDRLDLALVESGVAGEALCHEPIGSDRLCLAAPAGHPLLTQPQEPALAQLAAGPLLLREPGSTSRTLLEHALAAASLPLRPAWESTSTQALLYAVGSGLGIAVLPEQLARSAAQQGRVEVRPLEGLFPPRQHELVWHRDKFLSRPIRQFMALCRETGSGGKTKK